MVSNAHPSAEGLYLSDFCTARLRRLCQTPAFADKQASAVQRFERVVEPWGRRPLGGEPIWPSYIGDDHTPVEFSLTFGAKTELRVLFEPLADRPSLAANRDVALNFLETFASDPSVDLGRFRRIQDLFCPPLPDGRFSIWLATTLSDTHPELKIYLNPAAHGPRATVYVIQDALLRLGFKGAWPSIATGLLGRGPGLDEITYLSLDLSPSRHARVKVYARHLQCTTADLEVAASASASHRPGDVPAFLDSMGYGDREIFDGRPPSTCYTFVSGTTDRPVASTLHFPVNGYATDDRAIQRHFVQSLRRFGIPETAYMEAVHAYADRPLESGVGLHSYVSFRRYRGEARLTAYLAMEAYKVGAVEAPPPAQPAGPRLHPSRFTRPTTESGLHPTLPSSARRTGVG